MKKTIMLSAAAIALGVQMVHTVTVNADELPAEQTKAKDETPANVDAEADSKAPEQEVTGDTVNEDLDGSEQETVADVNGSNDNPEKNPDDTTTTDKNDEDKSTQEETDVDSIKEYPVDDQGRPYDPETGRLIDTNGKKDHGWTDRSQLDADSVVRSGHLTDMVYGMWGDVASRPQTPKTEKLIEKIKAAAKFLQPEFGLHYSSRDELEAYFANFDKEMATIETYNDDGTPVEPVVPEEPVKPVDDTKKTSSSSSHSSNHSSVVIVENDTTESVDLTVTTIRQASLVTKDGKRVINRELVNDSAWHVEEKATINGQTMYRISENEWVSANDVK